MSQEERHPLTIVFVTDMFDSEQNGIVTSARRMCAELRSRGHTVRILSTGGNGPDRYSVNPLKIPVVEKYAEKQNYVFASPDVKMIREAFTDADVVHFFVPMVLSRVAVRLGKWMDKPMTAAFHVQPENITMNIGAAVGESALANKTVYRYLYESFYDRFRYIHCPSEFIKDQLTANGYTKHAKLFVISNGVSDNFQPPVHKRVPFPVYKDTFDIVMVGRLSPEKNQRILLEAVKKSRYASSIRIFLAGSGPDKQMLQELGKQLPNNVSIGYYKQPELLELMHSCDLYVHTASVEIEAIACLEAIATGLVPLVANSPKSATRQFTLDDRNLFKDNDPEDLARAIDYWIENPLERERMSQVYADSVAQYRMSACADKMEEMLYEAVEGHEAARRKEARLSFWKRWFGCRKDEPKPANKIEWPQGWGGDLTADLHVETPEDIPAELFQDLKHEYPQPSSPAQASQEQSQARVQVQTEEQSQSAQSSVAAR